MIPLKLQVRSAEGMGHGAWGMDLRVAYSGKISWYEDPSPNDAVSILVSLVLWNLGPGA